MFSAALSIETAFFFGFVMGRLLFRCSSLLRWREWRWPKLRAAGHKNMSKPADAVGQANAPTVQASDGGQNV